DSLLIHSSDAIIVPVGDVESVIGADGDSDGISKEGLDRRAAVTRKARRTGARHSRDNTACIHSANTVVQAVYDIQITLRVESDAVRPVQRGLRRGSAIARKTALPGASHGRNNALRIYPANAVIEGIRNIDIAGRIDSYALRLIN